MLTFELQKQEGKPFGQFRFPSPVLRAGKSSGTEVPTATTPGQIISNSAELKHILPLLS